MTAMLSGIEISARLHPAAQEEVLTPMALAFVADLHRRFNPKRVMLLEKRAVRQKEFDAGKRLDFLPETREIREGGWSCAPSPEDLQDRRVEITGPCERKMMINALNSGAKVFMADLEDAYSPSWENVIQGQKNLFDAVRRQLELATPEGRVYRLKDEIATLLVRPRGWHLHEKHVLVDGRPIAASLFDFGLYVFHNAKERLARGTGPYFYLPKLESHEEAALWAEVFAWTERSLSLPQGAIKATVLIETICAAFEMEEILFALKDNIVGLNAGRWDYIFSVIKKFRKQDWAVLPDRSQVTMTVPFMRAYTELLVRTCHKRGAHAMGGMAAFIPSRKDPEVNEVALAKVREDKEREAGDGFDGTWVAHPDLVPVAMEVFDRHLGNKPHQKHRLRDEVRVSAQDLLAFRVPGGTVTENGVRNNFSVGMQYLSSWLSGNGAAAIFNLMEDAATAEISRAQLWQWLHQGVKLEDGRIASKELFAALENEEAGKLAGVPRLGEAREVLQKLIYSPDFAEFLTLLAYESLE